RAQHPVNRREPCVILRVVDEDVADRLRVLDKDVLPTEKFLDDDLFFEGFGGKRRERIAAQRSGHHAPRQPAGNRGRNGLGQTERLHSTASSGAPSIWIYTGRPAGFRPRTVSKNRGLRDTGMGELNRIPR